MSAPPLHEQVVSALQARFPGAEFRAHPRGHELIIAQHYNAADATQFYYATPPGQDYRQHQLPWLLHRFTTMIEPVYAAIQARDTLARAVSEE